MNILPIKDASNPWGRSKEECWCDCEVHVSSVTFVKFMTIGHCNMYITACQGQH